MKKIEIIIFAFAIHAIKNMTIQCQIIVGIKIAKIHIFQKDAARNTMQESILEKK